jgi:hypothetical protein
MTQPSLQSLELSPARRQNYGQRIFKSLGLTLLGVAMMSNSAMAGEEAPKNAALPEVSVELIDNGHREYALSLRNDSANTVCYWGDAAADSQQLVYRIPPVDWVAPVYGLEVFEAGKWVPVPMSSTTSTAGLAPCDMPPKKQLSLSVDRDFSNSVKMGQLFRVCVSFCPGEKSDWAKKGKPTVVYSNSMVMFEDRQVYCSPLPSPKVGALALCSMRWLGVLPLKG